METPNLNLKPGARVIVVMGPTGTGKTTFVNSFAPRAKFEVGHDLASCTQTIQTARITSDGEDVVIVDTPGFDDTNVNDAEVLTRIANWMKNNYAAGHQLSGIVYLHRISDNKVGGTSLRQLEMFRQLCGRKAFPNIILVTTMWSRVNDAVGQKRERELLGEALFWEGFVKHGARTMRFMGTQESATEIVSAFFELTSGPLLIQSEMVDEHIRLKKTNAADEVRFRLEKLRTSLRKELRAIEDEIRNSRNSNDAEAGNGDLAEMRKLISSVDDQLNELETRWYRKVFRNLFS